MSMNDGIFFKEYFELKNTHIYRTDLYMPNYHPVVSEHWKIKESGLVFDHGYYSGTWLCEAMPILLRREDGDLPTWETWMSLSPHEIESQEFGCRFAFGHTVVMGLGMGWFAVNAALNPRVDRITVIECDTEVIELFHQVNVLGQLPTAIAEKIVVQQADALCWKPDNAVDFLYADIWKHINESGTIDHTRAMQANINAERLYFWGQELALFEASGVKPEYIEEFDSSVLALAIERIGLPLLIPDTVGYADIIRRVVCNRIRRGLWRGEMASPRVFNSGSPAECKGKNYC